MQRIAKNICICIAGFVAIILFVQIAESITNVDLAISNFDVSGENKN